MIDPIPPQVELAIFLFLMLVGLVGLSLQAWLLRRHLRGTSSTPARDVNE